MNSPNIPTFSELALSPAVLKAIETIGYERPSPIQALTVPLLLAGKDVIGQAQTGTGKTAAFAWPLLSMLDLDQKDPQVLVLTPTRELAIQVAEAFQTYAAAIKGFHVLPVYGGSDFRGQLQGLRRGSHVIVGTPGRVMDHMRRGTLDLKGLKTLVLDEADEMLRMGFIDDVQWILEQMPAKRQIALFSATMPPVIRKIASQHLHEPEHITIAAKNVEADTIRQRYWPVSGTNKLDALTRILEAEEFTAMIVFVRTKILTVELADKLNARGFAASALNGDVSQQLREKTVDKLRKGSLDILIATDVAARGLDVERISHVINYDIPQDVETYVHRIGRTGRAGREGDAILFVAPREQRMLSTIERATRRKIALLELPSTEVINDKRISKFMQRITDTLAQGDLTEYTQIVERYQRDHNVPAQEIASALLCMVQGDTPLLLDKKDRSHKATAYPTDREDAAPRQRRERKDSRPSERSEARSEERPAERSFERPAERSAERPFERKAERKNESKDDRQRRFDEAPAAPFADKPERKRKFEDAAPSAFSERPAHKSRDDFGGIPKGDRFPKRDRDGDSKPERRAVPPPDLLGPTEAGMQRYRVEVGHSDNVKPGNIVGAIANEAGIDSKFIGRINIYDSFSVIDLPEGMPPKIMQHLKKVWVANKQLGIAPFDGGGRAESGADKKPFKRKKKF